MDVLDPAFPALVRAARTLLGWSQADLAQRAGVSVIFISRLERLTSVGRLRTLLKVAKALSDAGLELRCDEGGFGMNLDGEAAKELRARIRAEQLKNAAET